MADAPPSISNPQLPVDSPLAARPPRPAAHPDFRSIVAECMARGDQALAQSDLAAAARHYATAGVTYRFLGAADLAATAFLELAAAHLALGQRDRFAAVAATLRGLRQPGTPEGILFVRVELRVPATRLGLGFVEECDYASVTGSASGEVP